MSVKEVNNKFTNILYFIKNCILMYEMKISVQLWRTLTRRANCYSCFAIVIRCRPTVGFLLRESNETSVGIAT